MHWRFVIWMHVFSRQFKSWLLKEMLPRRADHHLQRIMWRRKIQRVWDNNHIHLCPSHIQTHMQTVAQPCWCAAVVAAQAWVCMLCLQNFASFAEDWGRAKVTAFLDRTALLCPFLAVGWVCQEYLDKRSVFPDSAGSLQHLIDCLLDVLLVLQLLSASVAHCQTKFPQPHPSLSFLF